ncbi:MAG: lipase maturation factor family protein [Bdellovibrionaceae bacterium]|nr:lipase maturation factor family protein [Pseudobdellovibrionaceae bacterium]
MRRLFYAGVSASLFFFALSAALQAPGLWGSGGLSPLRYPEIFGLTPGAGVGALSWTLVGLSLASFLPRVRFFAWLLFYPLALILMNGGGPFLSFQWDTLLLEVLVLAALLDRWGLDSAFPVWAGRVALFKLMFLSGCVKLQSGDPTWADLTALHYHFWTQPLPTPLAPFFEMLPDIVKKFMTVSTLALEIGGGFMLFLGRRARQTAAGSFILLQVVIALTGNYAFFNLLSATLALFAFMETGRERPRGEIAPLFARTAGGVLIVVSLLWCLRPFASDAFTRLDPVLMTFIETRVNSSYGLFAVMTTERVEVSIEGTRDGIHWQPYRFKWKPDRTEDCGSWIAPHQPRLDWQMWFLSLSVRSADWLNYSPWFMHLLDGIGEGRPAVMALLRESPFGEEPPRLLRVHAREFTPGSDACWNTGEPRVLLAPFTPDSLKKFIR